MVGGRHFRRGLHAHPAQSRVHIVHDGLLTRGSRFAVGHACLYLPGQVVIDLKKEVAQLMDGSGQVRIFKQADDAGLLGDVIRKTDLATGILLEDVLFAGIKLALVTDGGLHLGLFKRNVDRVLGAPALA